MKSGTAEYWLVVEDNEDDFLLFRRACQRAAQGPPNLHWAKDGLEAQRMLSGGQAIPAFIVCDVKMPGMDGLELLAWTKSQPSLRAVPFVMFSNSDAAQDIEEARLLGADAYQVKPNTLGELEAITRWWVECYAAEDARTANGCSGAPT